MSEHQKRKEEKECAHNKAKKLNNHPEMEKCKVPEHLITQENELIDYYKVRGYVTFGALLKLNMKKAKISVECLSHELGLCEKQIGRMRNDEVEMVSFRLIIAICVVLRLSLDKAEELLNTQMYSLGVNNPYVDICKMLLLHKISLRTFNRALIIVGFAPLTKE